MFNPQEVKVDDLANKIFKEPPKSSHSIQLLVEENMETVFFILLELLKKGISILFENKNIFEISEDEFKKLRTYFQSFGFDINLEIKPYGEKHTVRTDFNDLSEMNLTFHNEVLSYNIFFDFYKDFSKCK
jgi:hypothetical protein